MQCKCGGETKTSEAVQTAFKARLAFYECKSCMTVSSAELFIRNTLVATDPESRSLFASLTKSSADTLYAENQLEKEREKAENLEMFSMGELF